MAEQFGKLAGVEFVVAPPGPLVGFGGGGAVKGLGHGAKRLLDVKTVHNLYGAREQFLCDVPGPRSAIADDDRTLGRRKLAARGFAQDALGEGRWRWIGIQRRSALDGCRVGYRAFIAHGAILGVAGFGTPHRAQLHLAGLGRSIGLLTAAAPQFLGAHGNRRAIDTRIQRGRQRQRGNRRHVELFVFGDLSAERFGGALHLLGIDRDARQFLQQLAAFCKAHQCPHGCHHRCDGGRQRGAFQA